MDTVRPSGAHDYSGRNSGENEAQGPFRGLAGEYTWLCLLGTGLTCGWSLWSLLKRKHMSLDWLIRFSKFFLFLTLSAFWKIRFNQGQVNLVGDFLELAHGLMPPTSTVVFPT